ncbi:hypothetical protein HN873_058426 [Arachis hypogaea]
MEGPLNQAKKAEKAVTCCSSYLGALCLEQTDFTPTIASQHKPLTLFSAVTLTSLASPPWILPPSLQTRDLFRCHHWFSFTPSGATTVPCLDRTSFSIVVVFVTNWDLQQRVSDLQQSSEIENTICTFLCYHHAPS